MMKTRLFKIAVILSSLIPSICSGEIIQFGFTATVNHISDESGLLEGQINSGDSVTGFYTFNSLAEDEQPLPEIGYYRYTSIPYGISLTINDLTFQTDPAYVDFSIKISNNYEEPRDFYNVESYINNQLSEYLIIDYIWLAFGDYTGNSFSNDSLILTPFLLSNFQLKNLIIHGSSLQVPSPPDKVYPFEIIGQIDTLYLIPEPTTASLLILGLGGIFVLRRRR